MEEINPLKKKIDTISLLVGIATVLIGLLMIIGFSLGDAPSDYEWKRRNIGAPIAYVVFISGGMYCFLYVVFRIAYRKNNKFEKSVALVLAALHIIMCLILQGIFICSDMKNYFCPWILFPSIGLDVAIIWLVFRFRQIEKNVQI